MRNLESEALLLKKEEAGNDLEKAVSAEVVLFEEVNLEHQMKKTCEKNHVWTETNEKFYLELRIDKDILNSLESQFGEVWFKDYCPMCQRRSSL